MPFAIMPRTSKRSGIHCSVSILRTQYRYPDARICYRNSSQLVYMSTYYREIPGLITRLKSSSLSIDVAFGLLGTARTCVESALGPNAEPAREKLRNLLLNNPGLSTSKNILSVLHGEGDPSTVPLTMAEIPLVRYAPMVSTDVERSFSRYKALLTDRRLSLTLENAKYHIVSICTSGENLK